jgi:hypothetical protein
MCYHVRAIYKSLNEAPNGPVMLSAAQNLCWMGREILRCAQHDRANLTTCKSPWLSCCPWLTCEHGFHMMGIVSTHSAQAVST